MHHTCPVRTLERIAFDEVGAESQRTFLGPADRESESGCRRPLGFAHSAGIGDRPHFRVLGDLVGLSIVNDVHFAFASPLSVERDHSGCLTLYSGLAVRNSARDGQETDPPPRFLVEFRHPPTHPHYGFPSIGFASSKQLRRHRPPLCWKVAGPPLRTRWSRLTRLRTSIEPQ